MSIRQCPFCKEDVRSDAIKCKHCLSALRPETPDHAGTCPYCKEDIKSDALRCKHCKSDLTADTQECGCAGAGTAERDARRFFAVAQAPQQPTFGQGCFYECIDRHIGHGDTYGPGLHRHCENRCQISMPTQNSFFSPWQMISRF